MNTEDDRGVDPGVTAFALAVIVFLQIPVIVVVLAAFSTTSYLTRWETCPTCRRGGCRLTGVSSLARRFKRTLNWSGATELKLHAL